MHFILNELIYILLLLFFAITFLESGIDKIVNKNGNLDWLRGHFSKSFIAGAVTPLFYWITFQEVFVGILSCVAIIMLYFGQVIYAQVAFLLAFCVLLQLFAGQRIAKDYAGASGIIPYIIVCIMSIVLISFAG